jgi:hypothetical protein
MPETPNLYLPFRFLDYNFIYISDLSLHAHYFYDILSSYTETASPITLRKKKTLKLPNIPFGIYQITHFCREQLIQSQINK